MKTVLTMQKFNIMRNYSKYICLFLMIMGTSAYAWGDAIKTSDLDFGTAAFSVDFNSLSTTSESATSSTKYNNGSMSGFTPFTHYYMGTNGNGAQSISIAGSSGAMTSNHMAFVITNNGLATSFNYSFKSTGAFSFKILKTSNVNIGIYTANAYSTGTTYFSHAAASVFLQCTSSEIKLSAGRTSGTPQKWQTVTTDIPSTDVLEIHVVYNNTGSGATYGDDISLAANTAHVYINGNAVMDGDIPKAMYINGNSLTCFRICGQTASTSAKIDDIAIYDALPTKAGDAITLDKNNSDLGSTGGTGSILADATSMTIDAAPTRTGYTVEGYYTAASDGTKIAAANGDLQANVSVSSTDWTNGSGEWQNVGDKTFYTYWSPIEYLVEFNKNSASATGTMEDQEFVYGTAQNLSTCAFSRAGFSFSGWATSEDGSKVYNDEAEVNNLTSTEDDIITLYAVWTPNNYKLTVGEPSHVTIKATPEDKSDITEGNYDDAVPCEAIIALNAVAETGYTQAGWKITKDADGSDVTADYLYDETTMFMPPFDATVTATMYSDYVFSCSELTLTPKLVTAGTPIFITSTASKTVRSQDSILIVGNGLTPSTALTFPELPSNFVIKSRTGGTLQTDASGEINAVAYIYYTPAADASTDGLDKLTGITVSVGGAKPKQVSLTQEIIGRHLPTDFVIAVKKNGKWYALPANMSGTGNPEPVEIAVDDINNPTIAYTAASNVYNLYLSADKEKVQLGMKNNVDGSSREYALWANNADKSTDIGKNTGLAENTLGNNYKWTLTQTNTSITNPQDAKYTISNLNNVNPLKSWFAAGGGPKWGLYASGVEELRLIPASDIVFTEAYFVEWGQHGGVIEVDATGIDATSVIAHLNGASSAAISLVQTKAGDAKNNSSKYNYTVNFGGGIDFAAAASNGAMLTLEWKKGETVKAMSNIVVPKIVASTKVIVNSENYPSKSIWETEVHVLPGDTLEIDASGYAKKVVTISELNIYPGATVKIVGTNDSLNVRSLVLRNGWTRVGTKRYDVARLYVGNTSYLKKANNKDQWYSDWYIDYDQYYPIAVPFPVATSSISYKNSNSAATAGVRLRYYSGALRATNIQQNQDANWVEYNWNGSDPAMPTNLEPSHGYIMTARRPTGKAFSIVRMPLTFSNDWTALGEKGEVGGTHKDQVTVTAYGDESTPSYAKGWNIIANPYMAVYTGTIEYGDGTKVNVVNIPDVDFREYDQVATATAKLKPGSAFLVQAPETGVVTFGAANRKLSTPSYRREVREETEPEQQAYIVLSNEEAEDMMGIFVSDKYTAEYDLNGDVEKMLSDGTTLRTYMRYNDMNMAYVAIDKVLAQEPIPVSVRIPNDGEYTFSLHEASIVANLEGIYLIDHYEGNRETNLLEEGYTFYSPAGTIADRFTINAKVGARDVPTDIDVTDAEKNSGKAVKFLYRDKLYIMRSGRIYDATGKQVKGGAQ